MGPERSYLLVVDPGNLYRFTNNNTPNSILNISIIIWKTISSQTLLEYSPTFIIQNRFGDLDWTNTPPSRGHRGTSWDIVGHRGMRAFHDVSLRNNYFFTQAHGQVELELDILPMGWMSRWMYKDKCSIVDKRPKISAES